MVSGCSMSLVRSVFSFNGTLYHLEHPATHTNGRAVPPEIVALKYFQDRCETKLLDFALLENFEISLDTATTQLSRNFSNLRVPKLTYVEPVNNGSAKMHSPSVRHGARGLRRVMLRYFMIAAVFLR